MSLRCRLGYHKWNRQEGWPDLSIPASLRFCIRCRRMQGLYFYSNRTSDWEWL